MCPAEFFCEFFQPRISTSTAGATAGKPTVALGLQMVGNSMLLIAADFTLSDGLK